MPKRFQDRLAISLLGLGFQVDRASDAQMVKGKVLMKKSVFLAAALSAYAVSATTKVEVSSVAVDTEKSCVKVQYRLAGDESIVTARFFLDGQPIEEKYHANVVGDVNRLVEPTAEGECRKIYWQMDKLWTDRSGSGVFSVELTAYSKSSPPDYMVFDLQSPTNIPYNSVRFYTSTNALPGGIGDIAYRKEKMVFRRIPAAGVVWQMGSPAEEPYRKTDENQENRHKVRLSSDYYMAVFESTHGQSEYIFKGTSYSNPADNSLLKDKDVSYAQGNVAFYHLKKSETDEAVDYLAIGKLRNISGIAFDLPTEAQWEYACRAGTGTSLNNNMDIDDKLTSKRTRSLGWIYFKTGGPAEDGEEYGPRPVGMKIPNAWGLYDMHGNVAELCRDAAYRAYPSDNEIHDNPVGAQYDNGLKRVLRGGYFSQGANDCRSASRFREGTSGAYKGFGFRLIAPIPLDGAAAQGTSSDEGAVVLPGELGQYESSGVESGYWDVSARPPRTVVRSAVVSTAQAVSYDTRRYTEDEDLLSTLYRMMGGMFILFR
jgi:formylglycine-generating enzyme required for sulfatase activity